MNNSVRKIKNTTQKFTEVEDVTNSAIFLSHGRACSILEVTAVNFPLLSPEEQASKIYAYSSFLNSLAFSIQILIQSKKIDISSYIKLLDSEMTKAKNQTLAEKIKLYKEFVASLVKVNSVLDKKIYIVIPYSELEEGIIKSAGNIKSQKQTIINQTVTALKLKEESIVPQLSKIGLRSRRLNNGELVLLLHSSFSKTDIYPNEMKKNQ